MTVHEESTLEEVAPESDVPGEGATSRRSFVSKGAIAAAIGAAAGLALSDRASAANGNDLNLGDVDNPDVIADNTATNTTRIYGGSTFEVWGGGSSGGASIYGNTASTLAASLYGVRGDYDGTDTDGAGVYGYHSSTSASGSGVQGETKLGNGVYGLVSNSAGGGRGVHGVTEGTSGGEGVRGESGGTDGYGVRGITTNSNAIGVSGEAADGVGVSGSATVGVGVSGSGSRYDLEAGGSGVVRWSAAVATDVTATSTGAIGSLARNSDGSLWYCYAASAWQRLAGPSISGGFTAVTPFRVYDSRQETDGRFDGDENRTISVADARDVDTYAVSVADAVPEGATAVTGNVVAIGTTDLGFLSINPGGVTAISAASVNWAAGQNIGNAGTFALNDSRELEAVFGPGAGAHMTIDVTGYYL